MKLLAIKIEASHEVEDALTYFAQETLTCLGVEVRKRSDFEQLSQLHDSTVVDFDDISNLPVDMEMTIFFDQEADRDTLVHILRGKLQELEVLGLEVGQVKVTSSYIEDHDWNTAWQKYYHPIDLTRHLAIVPEWEKYQPAFADQQQIILNPGLAFGTGNHTTTQLALIGLEQVMVKPKTVIDVGTGSGILAICAAKLGAKSVYATDISDEAITASQENFALNNLNEIGLQKTSLLTDVKGKFDIIVANILADILLELVDQLDEHLAADGDVIFSGIDYLQSEKVIAKLNSCHFDVISQTRQGRWVSLLIKKHVE